MEPNFFEELLDSENNIIKIVRGTGHHTCYLCKKWLQKRKIKVLRFQGLQNYILCFECWREYSEWKVKNGHEEPTKIAKNKVTKFRIPINR